MKMVRGGIILLMALCCSGVAWGATGSVTLDLSEDLGGVCMNFTITGTYSLTEDETPSEQGAFCNRFGSTLDYKTPAYWDFIQWSNTYAQLCFSMDGRVLGCSKITQLGVTGSIGVPVDLATLQPGIPHKFKAYIEDIYGLRCKAPVQWEDPFPVVGGIVDSGSVKFTNCDRSEPGCCEPCPGDICCQAGGGDSAGAGSGNAGNEMSTF